MHYIATSRDHALIPFMYRNNQTWAEVEMKFFHDLVKRFYQVDDNNGYFLDLGANIGTTGIYFTKKIAPNLKLLAFEPDPENFKLLRANLILNDADKNTIIENCGLGMEESELTLYTDDINPGARRFFSTGQQKKVVGTVKVIPLDKYFTDNKLSAAEIKYIWIDTEGFEPQVLLGAQNILRENPAPIFMEFNPDVYKKFNMYERMMTLLTGLYESYIYVDEALKTNKVVVYPINKLWDFQNVGKQIGDIFLIRKS